MNFDTFLELNEAKSNKPNIHVFKKQPSFKTVSELTVGDFYAVTGDNDAFNWDDGKFNVSLFPVTRNKEFFNDIDGNFVTVEIDPEYETSVDDDPSGFNSESGNVSYTSGLLYEGIDLKASSYKFYVEDYIADGADDETIVEHKRYTTLAKSLNAKTVRECFGGAVEDAINKLIDDQHDDISKFESKRR